ncbi:MAG: class I SAM-dependent methyltransferase [Betaproteobacteria bacterium]
MTAIQDVVRERGPMTVAAFMDLALYDPEFGYYARAARRSGRAGDFFTSVDVGPVFGDLLEIQIAEMFDILSAGRSSGSTPPAPPAAVLVEAGAGNGRLSADVLDAARRRHPPLFARMRVHLVDASPGARAAQESMLGDLVGHLASSSSALPESFEGVLFANELLDALPVHQVVMREDGLREVYVSCPTEAPRSGAPLETIEGPLSTPALGEYLDRIGVVLEPGWRAEINLRAVEWIREAARRLRRGFMILIDYGHEARDLYGARHAAGTLTTFSRHTSPAASGPEPAWLQRPGEQDITAHVDFTSVLAAAGDAGLDALGFLDQTYFLLGLGADEMGRADESLETLKRRLALKTLLMPGGLGSTHKVLLLGKDVGRPALRGCSFRVRVT